MSEINVIVIGDGDSKAAASAKIISEKLCAAGHKVCIVNSEDMEPKALMLPFEYHKCAEPCTFFPDKPKKKMYGNKKRRRNAK